MGPVTAGSLIQRSFEVFRAGFVPFFTLALIFYSPVAVLQLMALGSAGSDPGAVETGSVVALMLAYVLLIPIASAAVVYGVFQGLRGRPATIGQCISVAAARWLAILGLAILTVVVVFVGYMMCVIPGVVLTYGLFIAGPVLIVEQLEPTEAMKRSWQLTDGYKLILFVLALAIGVLQFAATVVVNLAFGTDILGSEALPASPGLYQITSSLVTVVFTAFNAIAAGVAYHDLRSFREGLDEDELVAVFD